MPRHLSVDVGSCAGPIDVKEPRTLGPNNRYRGESTSKNILPPFSRQIKVTSEWSNGYTENSELEVNLAKNKKYVLFSIEIDRDQDIKDFYIRPVKIPERIGNEILYNFGDIAGPTIVLFLLPIIIPIAIVNYFSETEPTRRPYDNCCYIWIEDFDTGEVVSGHKP